MDISTDFFAAVNGPPKLHDFADCLICCQTFNSTDRAPIVLSCGHTFCRFCVEKVVFSTVLKCFECRSASVIGKNGPTVNVTLLRTLESLKLLATNDIPIEAPCVEYRNIPEKEMDMANTLTTQLIAYVVQEGDDRHSLWRGKIILSHVRAALLEYKLAVYDRASEALTDDYNDDGDDGGDTDDDFYLGLTEEYVGPRHSQAPSPVNLDVSENVDSSYHLAPPSPTPGSSTVVAPAVPDANKAPCHYRTPQPLLIADPNQNGPLPYFFGTQGSDFFLNHIFFDPSYHNLLPEGASWFNR